MTADRPSLNLFDPNPPTETVGVMFVDDGTPYDPAGTRPPLTDDEHAAWMLHHHGPVVADRQTELHKAIAGGAPGWQRRRGSGYLHHAIRQADGHTAIVIWDPTGWAWQVWRDGDHKPARAIREKPAVTAAEAVRLADEFVAKANGHTPEMLTAAEVATIAGVDRTYVARWCSRYGIERVWRDGDNRYWYPGAKVRAAREAELRRRAVPAELRLRRWAVKARLT